MTEKKPQPTSPNMAIWDAVSKTDPAHTKKVNQRGGFTAISAHYQIMSATQQFGPIGIGWGYINGHPVFQDGLVIIPVTIWHGTRDNTYGPLYGAADMKDTKGRADSDAPKKASTDGLTKGLSQLGFNADVFLGRFDDNKYLEQMRQEFGQGEGISAEQCATLRKMIAESGASEEAFCDYVKCGTLPELPATNFDRAVQLLNKRITANKGNTND